MFWPICCLILSIIVFIVCISLYVIFSDDHGFLVTILVVISIVGIFFAAGNFDDKREEKTISIEEPSVTVYDNKQIVDLNKVNEEGNIIYVKVEEN